MRCRILRKIDSKQEEGGEKLEAALAELQELTDKWEQSLERSRLGHDDEEEEENASVPPAGEGDDEEVGFDFEELESPWRKPAGAAPAPG